MNARNCSGLSWVEVVVLLFVLAVLALFALPSVLSMFVREGNPQMLSNMKQLHLATQSAALDGETTGDKSLGWPGDIGGTFSNWVKQTVPEYLGTNDFCKLLSGPGKTVPLGRLPRSMSESAVLVYAVSSNSSAETLLLSTANFTNTPTGGAPLLKSAKPYGDKGFVIFKKGGDGAILLKNQTSSTNLIGSYVPLLK